MQPIGRQSRIECRRPTCQFVPGITYHGWTDASYEDGYRQLLASRWPEVRDWPDSRAIDVNCILVWFCTRDTCCHRHLIAQMLAKRRPDIEFVVR
jgi:hypothetical protein